jgi:hypothetical protein
MFNPIYLPIFYRDGTKSNDVGALTIVFKCYELKLQEPC